MSETITGRIIYSGWQGSEIEDEEQAEALVEAIQAAAYGKIRRSWSRDEHGHIAIEAYVVGFEDPADGANRWATYYRDAQGAEYIDYPERSEAEAAYEENARSMQDAIAGTTDDDGLPATWWDETDVDGLDDRSAVLIKDGVERVEWSTSAMREAEGALTSRQLDRADAIRVLIERCGDNQSEAARLLGLGQSTVNKLLKRFPPRVAESGDEWELMYGIKDYPDGWSLHGGDGWFHAREFGPDEVEAAQEWATETVRQNGASVEAWASRSVEGDGGVEVRAWWAA